MAEFGTGLRALILARYPSLRQFAQAVDMDPAYVSRIVNGRIERPERETLARFAATLRVPYAQLARLAGALPPEDATRDDGDREVSPDDVLDDILTEARQLVGADALAVLRDIRDNEAPAVYRAALRLYAEAWASNFKAIGGMHGLLRHR